MNLDHLRRLDLNLLVVFAALMRERSTTRAAQQLFITQSAVSHALKRLRSALGDELFVRSRHALAPTLHAEALWQQLQPALSGLQSMLVRPAAFDPGTSQAVFRIGMPSALDVSLTPALLARFRQQAPQVNLVVRPANVRDVAAQLDADTIDLAVTVIGELPAWQRRAPLATSRFVSLYDPRKVKVKPPISLERFVELPHVLTSYSGDRRGVVDEALDKLGLSRRVLVASADFASVAMYLTSAGAIATLPDYAARRFAAALNLATSPPPVALEPIELSMAWHARADGDPAQRWFRDAVVAAAQEL